jgi:hypothetical protein
MHLNPSSNALAVVHVLAAQTDSLLVVVVIETYRTDIAVAYYH